MEIQTLTKNKNLAFLSLFITKIKGIKGILTNSWEKKNTSRGKKKVCVKEKLQDWFAPEVSPLFLKISFANMQCKSA